MQHRTSHRTLALAAVASLTGVVAAAHAGPGTDSPIVIDAVDLTTEATRGMRRSSDFSNDASTGSWSGLSRQDSRQTRTFAANDVEWDDSGIRGVMYSEGRTRFAPAGSESRTVIDFTVPNRDRSRPDSSWGWSGISAMESLYRDFGMTPPSTCRASISCSIECSRQSGPVGYRLHEPFASASAPRVAGLLLLREGIPIATCLIDATTGVDRDDLEVELELLPGEYSLIVSAGADLARSGFGYTTANLALEYQIDFANEGPGDGEYAVHEEWEQYLLDAGGMPAQHEWAEVPHDTYRSRSIGSSGVRASASGIVDYQSGGLTAFRHLRATQTPASPAPESAARNELDLVFGLPHRMDVGIGSIAYLVAEESDRSLNDGRWRLVVRSLDDDSTVWEQEITPSDVDAAGFHHDTDWVTLDSGAYRITLTGDAVARQAAVDTGADLGFWLAVSFEVP